MTREDLELDPQIFLRKEPLTLYRLARAKYANLSGVGGALYPGRWNRLGQEAIYTSTEMGVPVLERLVHTPKDLIPSNMAMMKIRVSAEWERQGEFLLDARSGACLRFYRDLLTAKDRFGRIQFLFGGGVDPFAVALPSVVVPAWNVVLYPRALGFWYHVSLESIEPFEFDPRLFPEGTPPEEAE